MRRIRLGAYALATLYLAGCSSEGPVRENPDKQHKYCLSDWGISYAGVEVIPPRGQKITFFENKERPNGEVFSNWSSVTVSDPDGDGRLNMIDTRRIVPGSNLDRLNRLMGSDPEGSFWQFVYSNVSGLRIKRDSE